MGKKDVFAEKSWLFSNSCTVSRGRLVPCATTTHSQLTADELVEQGIKTNTVRLSIGTEHIDDILTDLQRGFDNIA